MKTNSRLWENRKKSARRKSPLAVQEKHQRKIGSDEGNRTLYPLVMSQLTFQWSTVAMVEPHGNSAPWPQVRQPDLNRYCSAFNREY